MFDLFAHATIHSALTMLPQLSGLSRSITTHPWTILLILIGIAGICMGVIGMIQTRRWPQPETKPVVEDASEVEPTPQVAPQRKTVTPVPLPPTPDRTSPLKIRFPQIQNRHPEVWAYDEPLEVTVSIDPSALNGDTPRLKLLLQQSDHATTIGDIPIKDRKEATFAVTAPAKGEAHLIARLDPDDAKQNSRRVRFVDYRSEIVETFEDFEKWAHAHYTFPRRTLTAREFTDRYADMVLNTPIAPLDKIVDIYELANYSEHPVDRSLYLQLVEAFLELEDAGALEGPTGGDREET